MARPATNVEILRKIRRELSDSRIVNSDIYLSMNLRIGSFPIQLLITGKRNGYYIYFRSVHTGEKEASLKRLKLGCLMAIIENILPMTYNLVYTKQDIVSKKWERSLEPFSFVSTEEREKERKDMKEEFLQSCSTNEIRESQDAFKEIVQSLDPVVFQSSDVPTIPLYYKNRVAKEIEDVVTGEMKDEEIEPLTKECDVKKFQSLWLNPNCGPLPAVMILLACLLHRVNMDDVTEGWYELKKKLEESDIEEDLQEAFFTLYYDKKCFYSPDSSNFVYDYYMEKGLQCISGSMIVYLLAKRRNIPVALRFFENHVDAVVKLKSNIIRVESTDIMNTMKTYEPQVNVESVIVSEQVLALYELITQLILCDLYIDLSIMFGSVFDNSRIRSFREYALNAQKPIMVMNSDGYVFANILYEDYRMNVILEGAPKTFILGRNNPNGWLRRYFEGEKQDPNAVFLAVVEDISRIIDGYPKKPNKLHTMNSLLY